MKNLKKNQVIIFVIALMLMTAGYLNFSNEQNQNLMQTSSLADSKDLAAIGDATLVNANQTKSNGDEETAEIKQNQIENTISEKTENNKIENSINQNNIQVENKINNSAETNNKVDENDSYFAQSKLDRDAMYSQMLANYQKVLETDKIDAEEKNTAQTEIKRINNEKNAIMIAENLIKTKGFEDVVLFVNNGNVSSIIKAEKLDENQIAQIQNIITRELNVKVNKINVSSKK